MRTNLLPHERRRIDVSGVSLDLEFVKRTLGLIALAAFAFGTVAGIQWLRAEAYRRQASRLEAELGTNDHLRQRIAKLAREVALLQRIDEASAAAHYSGNHVGLEIIRIGNAIPRGVWLDTLGRNAEGYLLSGGAHGIPALADALQSLAASGQRSRAMLVRLDQPEAADALRFTLSIPAERALQ
jgi:Tfp pilus assembly protein PilN